MQLVLSRLQLLVLIYFLTNELPAELLGPGTLFRARRTLPRVTQRRAVQ